MRIHLFLETGTGKSIPFEHQHLLVGTLHKWLGQNELHGTQSLFSFSQLQRARLTEDKKALHFPLGTNFFISAHDGAILLRIIKGIQKDPSMFHGLSVQDLVIEEQEPRYIDRQERFEPASPILIKEFLENETRFLTYEDPQAGVVLCEIVRKRMATVGLEDPNLEIQFDLSDPSSCSTRLTDYKGIKNRANSCPIIIKGSKESKLFIRNVGLGHSTGIGFGAIK